MEQLLLLTLVALGGASAIAALVPLMVERHDAFELILSLPFP